MPSFRTGFGQCNEWYWREKAAAACAATVDIPIQSPCGSPSLLLPSWHYAERESDSWDGGGKCNGSQASPLTVLTFISRRRVHFALLHYARHFTRDICPGCNKRMMWWCSTVMSMWHPTQFTALSLTVTGSPVLNITISLINIHSASTDAIYHHDCCGRPSIEWLMDHLINIAAIRCGKLLRCQYIFKEKPFSCPLLLFDNFIMLKLSKCHFIITCSL